MHWKYIGLRLNEIETPRSKADEESDSANDFFIVLFAYPETKPSGNALTGIQKNNEQNRHE